MVNAVPQPAGCGTAERCPGSGFSTPRRGQRLPEGVSMPESILRPALKRTLARVLAPLAPAAWRRAGRHRAAPPTSGVVLRARAMLRPVAPPRTPTGPRIAPASQPPRPNPHPQQRPRAHPRPATPRPSLPRRRPAAPVGGTRGPRGPPLVAYGRTSSRTSSTSAVPPSRSRSTGSMWVPGRSTDTASARRPPPARRWG